MEKNTITATELRKQLGNFIKVSGLPSPRTYENVANQYKLIFENGSIFQSYDTLIAAKVNGKLYLTKDHEYSVTTSKYCRVYCGYDTKERRQKLAEGTIGILITE